MLDKKTALYDRDEKGELLPVEVELEIEDGDSLQEEYLGETIKLVPIPRGKIKRLFSTVSVDDKDTDMDGTIIKEHCVEPSFTETEVDCMKPVLSAIIVNTIFRESGIRAGKNKKKAVLKAEDEFAKN